METVYENRCENLRRYSDDKCKRNKRKEKITEVKIKRRKTENERDVEVVIRKRRKTENERDVKVVKRKRRKIIAGKKEIKRKKMKEKVKKSK